MGYRSDITFTIVGPEPEMTAAIAQFRLTNTVAPENSPFNPTYTRIGKDGDNLVLHVVINQWKWYDDYADVKAFKDLWDFFYELDNTDTFIRGGFVRLGEDDSDVETLYFNDGFDLVGYERNIRSAYEFDKLVDIREPEALSSTIE